MESIYFALCRRYGAVDLMIDEARTRTIAPLFTHLINRLLDRRPNLPIEGGQLMSRILRWSRCAFAILLAIQAFPSASLAQERWVGNAYPASTRPVRVAQIPEPEASSGVRMAGIATNDQIDASSSSYISDGGSDIWRVW